jgi:hypothetical protein
VPASTWCDAGGERAALEGMARTISAVLATLGIHHRLELYDEDDREMFAYLHHGWPLDQAAGRDG